MLEDLHAFKRRFKIYQFEMDISYYGNRQTSKLEKISSAAYKGKDFLSDGIDNHLIEIIVVSCNQFLTRVVINVGTIEYIIYIVGLGIGMRIDILVYRIDHFLLSLKVEYYLNIERSEAKIRRSVGYQQLLDFVITKC